MKPSYFEYGKVVSSSITNPMAWDTVLENVNDRLGQPQPAGLSVTSWSGPQARRRRNLHARLLLALGMASVLATGASYAEVMAGNQTWDFFPPSSKPTQSVATQPLEIRGEPLDINGDGMPDLSCTASFTFEDGRVNGEVECIDSNGEGVSVGQGTCDLPGKNEEEEALSETCPEGADNGVLVLKTSSGQNAWVKMEIDADRLAAKAVAWGYESCAGQPIGAGQTTGGVTCPPTDTVITESTTTDGTDGPPLYLPIPPSELTSPIDSSGNVRLCWKDNSNNETGFKVSRDGKLIEMTAANLTCYTDTGLPPFTSEVTYTVVATNDAGDSAPVEKKQVIVEVCQDCVMLFIAVDGSGSGKITNSSTGISCEVSNCHDDPKDPQVPKCNPQKCAASVDIGKTVMLTPHPVQGSYFSSWGGHEDCVDGQVTMTNSKLCIAFFRQNEPNDSLRPPEETRISQGLCEGVAFDSEGKDQSTSAQFEGRVLVNGVDVATVKTTDQVDILGYIRIDSQHLSLPADIFASASHQATVQEKPTYWMIENNKFLPWDENPAHLVPFRKEVLSSGELSVEVYHGKMPASGIMKFHLGYRLEDGTVVCSSRSIEINVEK